MLYERRVLLSMDSLSKVVSVASLSFKLLPGVACLMLWSLCKLSVTMVHPVLLHDHWVQDQVLGEGVTAQKQNLELPLSLNRRLREPAQSAMSWAESGNVGLQCQ